MRSHFDRAAGVLAIDLEDLGDGGIAHGELGEGVIVLIGGDGRVIGLKILSAAEGAQEKVNKVAERYGLDPVPLLAAAYAGLAAPDHEVVLDIGRAGEG